MVMIMVINFAAACAAVVVLKCTEPFKGNQYLPCHQLPVGQLLNRPARVQGYTINVMAAVMNNLYSGDQELNTRGLKLAWGERCLYYQTHQGKHQERKGLGSFIIPPGQHQSAARTPLQLMLPPSSSNQTLVCSHNLYLSIFIFFLLSPK